MPKYYPIDVGCVLRASGSDLLRIDFGVNGISADFIIPDNDEQILRVKFDTQCIVRLLDEMPLSTEDDFLAQTRDLYRSISLIEFEDAAFARMQSEAWVVTMQVATGASVGHFRFVTGST